MKQSSTLSLLLVLSFFFSSQLCAQVSFDIGARAGFGFNGANINGTVDTSSQTILFTPSFNLAAELGFANRVFIQPELGFTQKGWRLGADETLLGENLYVERLNYRELPILLKVAIKSDEMQTLMVYAGPSFTHLNKATEKINLLGIEEEIEHDLETTDIYKVSDVGFVLGVGGKFGKENKGKFVADMRLSSGTSPYKELTQNGTTTTFNAWTLNFSFGYMLPLIK